MSFRITSGMMSRTVLRDLQAGQLRLAATYEQMTSGKQITRPSDDPYGTTRAMHLRTELSQIAQSKRNVSDAQGWQQASDSALQGISDAVQRARVLLVGAGNDAGGQSARDAAASEIDQLIKTVKGAANATYAGVPVFAGASTARPYDPDGTDAFSGDSGSVLRTIGTGVHVTVNADLAGRVLGQAGGDGKMLDALRTIVQHLRGGTAADADALRTTDLKGLDTQLDALSGLRAEVGATGTRLISASDRLVEVEEAATAQRSGVEEADAASTMIAYATQQATYQAALKAGAGIVQASLMDFLR
ncbi:flagellar hook-associated protein FlgL [Patulibacter minatonensis]|uniref:flagellar hook-associated protein FlgL n=1 Tax=Patulibacter minatonensis TaxID=298163 RepID=UPI00047C1008|nr:flagellar hook-associated protein FlgL [Patulibacter minatonensis]